MNGQKFTCEVGVCPLQDAGPRHPWGSTIMWTCGKLRNRCQGMVKGVHLRTHLGGAIFATFRVGASTDFCIIVGSNRGDGMP